MLAKTELILCVVFLFVCLKDPEVQGMEIGLPPRSQPTRTLRTTFLPHPQLIPRYGGETWVVYKQTIRTRGPNGKLKNTINTIASRGPDGKWKNVTHTNNVPLKMPPIFSEPIGLTWKITQPATIIKRISPITAYATNSKYATKLVNAIDPSKKMLYERGHLQTVSKQSRRQQPDSKREMLPDLTEYQVNKIVDSTKASYFTKTHLKMPSSTIHGDLKRLVNDWFRHGESHLKQPEQIGSPDGSNTVQHSTIVPTSIGSDIHKSTTTPNIDLFTTRRPYSASTNPKSNRFPVSPSRDVSRDVNEFKQANGSTRHHLKASVTDIENKIKELFDTWKLDANLNRYTVIFPNRNPQIQKKNHGTQTITAVANESQQNNPMYVPENQMNMKPILNHSQNSVINQLQVPEHLPGTHTNHPEIQAPERLPGTHTNHPEIQENQPSIPRLLPEYQINPPNIMHIKAINEHPKLRTKTHTNIELAVTTTSKPIPKITLSRVQPYSRNLGIIELEQMLLSGNPSGKISFFPTKSTWIPHSIGQQISGVRKEINVRKSQLNRREKSIVSPIILKASTMIPPVPAGATITRTMQEQRSTEAHADIAKPKSKPTPKLDNFAILKMLLEGFYHPKVSQPPVVRSRSILSLPPIVQSHSILSLPPIARRNVIHKHDTESTNADIATQKQKFPISNLTTRQSLENEISLSDVPSIFQTTSDRHEANRKLMTVTVSNQSNGEQTKGKSVETVPHILIDNKVNTERHFNKRDIPRPNYFQEHSKWTVKVIKTNEKPKPIKVKQNEPSSGSGIVQKQLFNLPFGFR